MDAIATEKFKITWVKSDSPPFNIASGDELVGKGICDGVMDEIIAAAPHIDFDIYLMPQTRFSKLMDSGAKVCYACMIHREKATSRATYSIPNIIYPPYVIATTPAMAEKIKEKFGEPVDLALLANDESFRLGRDSERRFDSNIQALLEESKAYKYSVVLFNETGAMTALMRMMEMGRLDYLIDYPSNFTYLNATLNIPLTTIAIKQNEGKFVKGAIGCATSAPDNFAQEALERINNVLKNKVLKSPSYLAHLNFWMSGSFSDYLAVYEEVVVNSQLNSNNTEQ